ncbi:MAG TPA: efflux RND transporter permease subunit [Usitatibacteraceae bacterium]|nr:efflux RND transporter permease subunit [Usitatibacteraceae bacterium]
MWFTRVSINNPVFATMVMMALMVLGLFSYQRLSVEQMPDVSIPVAVVRTAYPGASAEAVEQEVTRRLEEAVNTVSGIRTIRSGSVQGFSWVVAEFELNIDIKTAIQDVRDQVAEARRGFNRDVGEPTVSRADNDNDEPVMYLTMQSDARSLREVSDLAELLVVKRLQGAPGVGNIEVNGSVQRELAVFLRPEKMAAYGVGIEQVIAAIRTENQDVPAGALVSDETERVVRVKGRLRQVSDFERIIVARRGAGTVTLGQLADVRDTQREETSLATVNGKRGVSIQIRKTRGANTLEMSQAVHAKITDLKKSLPADVRLEVSFDRSTFIRDSVDNVKRTIVEGALLTVFIVFLFLHSWRSTVITGLTLPISVFATFIAMYAFGFTINFITLLALSLSIGVLIDDAIVVRENIVRHLGMGKTHRQAALEATQEIGLAVMATTFTIVAVFVPVAFMGGIIGKFFYQFGVTVVVAVMVSLFVSFTLDPMLSSVWRDPPSRWLTGGPIGWLLGLQQRAMDRVHAVYDRVLRWTFRPEARRTWAPKLTVIAWAKGGFRRGDLRLERVTIRNKAIVLWIATVTLLAAFGLVAAGLVKSEFVPRTDEGWTSLRIQTPVGSSLGYTTAKAEQVEAALKEYPEVKRISKSVRRNSAWFEIQLTPKTERKRSQKQMDDLFRDRLKRVAGLEVSIGWNRPIRLFVQGPDIKELDRISQDVMARIRAIPGTVDVESSFKPTSPALDIVVNRELASDMGVAMSQIAATTRALIGGEPAGQWEGPDGENHQILLRLPRDERTGIADLDKIWVASYSFNADATPRMVPLRQLADFRPSVSERQIDRRNLQRQIQVWGGLGAKATLGEVNTEVQKILKSTQLPAGYSFHQGGDSEMMQESGKYALIALGIAVIFIYLVLASQFGSFLQPLAIMASLPLSLIGVFLALMIFGSTLNIFSVIGFIMLMGLVTKNAILLVDFANQGIREGMSREEAILAAGQVRLRPILMTTAAMVFGMLPLALALGPGSEQQSPMAHAVIGGILTSTLLTLVVVPVLFTYFDTMGRRASAWLTKGVPVDAPATTRGGGEMAPSPAQRAE